MGMNPLGDVHTPEYLIHLRWVRNYGCMYLGKGIFKLRDVNLLCFPRRIFLWFFGISGVIHGYINSLPSLPSPFLYPSILHIKKKKKILYHQAQSYSHAMLRTVIGGLLALYGSIKQVAHLINIIYSSVLSA